METTKQSRLGDYIRRSEKKPKEASNGPWTAMLLCFLIAWGCYELGLFNKVIDRPVVIKEKSSQILFVVCDSMSPGQGQASSSLLIEKFCLENDIERRVLMKGQDTSGSEPWLSDMADKGYPNSPCIVFRSQEGEIEWVKIPNGVDETLDEIKERI